MAFALIFGPLVFLRARVHTVDGQAKALILLAMLFLLARFPLPELDAQQDPDRATPLHASLT